MTFNNINRVIKGVYQRHQKAWSKLKIRNLGALLKRVASLVLWAFLTLCAIWAWNNALFPPKWNYRMTIVVDTPEGPKTGSAVRRVSVHREPALIPAQGSGVFYGVGKGEAIVVDLGSRGLLFGAMRGVYWEVDYAHRVALRAFPLKEKTETGAKVFLTPDQYPMLLHFKDIRDPESIEAVLEADADGKKVFIKKDRFQEIYGEGVSLKAITIETTDDDVTQGIEEHLSWLPSLGGHTLSGRRGTSSKEIYDRLDSGDFIRK